MVAPSPALQPPTPPRKRPWPARWWAIVFIYVPVGLLVSLCAIGVVADVDPPQDPDEDRSAAADAADDQPAGDGEEADAEEAPEQPEDWFEAETFSGSGDDVLTLPSGAVEGMVTASHDGSSNFQVQILDANNESTFDLLVNEIGSYSGTTAFGLMGFGGDPASIEVVADGSWEITVAHLSTAPALELPAEGSGDAVFVYDQGPAMWTLTHEGSSNFMVDSTAAMMMLVNEIGSYEGTVPVPAGEGIVTINADGDWTITAD